MAQTTPVSPTEIEQMRAAAPATAPAAPLRPRKLLVYTASRGFVHKSIPYCTAALQVLGERTGAYTAVVADQPEVFAADRLRDIDAICFNNTTGELFTDAALRQSLLDFVRLGGGIVGIHAATDCFYEWPEFGALMGGYFSGHPWNASDSVTVKLDEPDHPLVAAFAGQPFDIVDEIYQFKEPYSRERLRVLLSLDTARTDMTKKGINRSDGDFAVSWVRNYGQGRVFYCSLGHNENVLWNAPVLAHYLAGIQFALGDLPAQAVPSAQVGRDGRVALLNGRDLGGWICKPGSWKFVDGALARQGGGDIWTEQVFGDFVLELEFKLDPQTNSGVFFRTADLKDPVQTGIEVQILDSHGKATVDAHDCGAIYDCVAPKTNAVKAPGEWNTMQLACRGPQITVVLNGQEVTAMNLDEWREAGKNPDGSPNKFRTAYQDMPRLGRIGFQDHGKPVWYRNVRVQPVAGGSDNANR